MNHHESSPCEASTPDILVSSFYKFAPIDAQRLGDYQIALSQWGSERGLRGLVLLAAEGINATISGAPADVRGFIAHAAQLVGHSEYASKESWAASRPFRRFQVKVRDEMVTFSGASYQPTKEDQGTHLSPREWNEWLRTRESLTVLDTRNWYESKLGTFKGAVAPPIQNFTELKQFLANSEIPRDKPLLMFCTGGIRCEKALPELRRLGFEQVYQLDGGILNYFASKDSAEFEGECFVFDHRVAVGHDLAPSSRYRLCPHCGNPAEAVVSCGRCGSSAVVCNDCLARPERISCSKNCAHHLARQNGLGSNVQR